MSTRFDRAARVAGFRLDRLREAVKAASASAEEADQAHSQARRGMLVELKLAKTMVGEDIGRWRKTCEDGIDAAGANAEQASRTHAAMLPALAEAAALDMALSDRIASQKREQKRKREAREQAEMLDRQQQRP